MTDQTKAPTKAAPTATDLAGQRTDMATYRTGMAVGRTLMASDRTLMAWIRTALSMISFGFTMYKFLEYMKESEGSRLGANGPRNFGLALIVLGTVSLMVAAIQNFALRKQMQRKHETPRGWSLSLSVSVAIVFLGALTFFSVAWSQGPF